MSSSFASELDALPRGDLDLEALDAFLAFNSIPSPLSIFREIRKLPAGHVLTWEEGRTSLERYARPGPLPARHGERRGRARRGVPRAPARLGPRASRRRRPGGRPALRRRRLGGADRARSAGELGARTDVLDRLRRAVVRRARRSPRRVEPVRHAPSRARGAAGCGAAAAGAGCGLRRALRRLVRAADLPRRGPRRRGRQGRALGRGRRRALRRVLHLRRRPARGAGRVAGRDGAAGGRAAALVVAAGELRLQGEAVRPGRAPAAARASPRLEGDLLRRRARRAHRPRRRRRSARRRSAGGSPRRRGTSS